MAIIKMIKNPPKTKSNLKKLMNYITQPAKTRPDLVGGFNCDWEQAFNEFNDVKMEFDKEDGIQARHMVMSFDVNDDVTVELAKQIGDELLQHKLFENFQVVYAVHKDKDHVHIHFCINSVNFENGKRWHQTSADLKSLKIRSNDLCRKYNLSEIELNQDKGSRTDSEINNRFESWKYELYLAAVNSSRRASSIDEFKSVMNELGYRVEWEENKKYITFTTPDGQKCRNRKMYPKYLFTKENLQKQFQDNSTTYSPEELKKIQKQFIDRVKSVEHQYPLSYIVSDDEKQTSMKYEKWYDRNREYLIDDDKYDVYKSLGYALKYSTSRGEFVSKLNKNGMNAEFDDETNITVFESRQGIEYGNYEMYQGEKYSPNELEKVFVKNRTEKDFYSSYWDCVKKSKSMKDFQEMMRDKGYGYSYENDKYIFFSCDNSTVINSQRIDDKVLQCFENKMNIYLSRMKWQSQTIDDFIEKLNKSGCSISTIAGKTVFKMGGYFFVNDDFQINSIKKDLNRRSDIKELIKSVGHSKMYALSKASFIHQLEEQGYKVEWNNDNILFILPNGKSYLNTELNPKADWFNVQTIEKQIHINLDRYIKNLMRQVHSTMDFVELLKSEQSNITGVTSSETMTKHDIEEILKDVGLDFRSLNEYYDLKNDKTELQNAIWQCSRCSLSKDDFILKMEQLGYKVEWEKTVEYDTVENENTNVSVGSTTFSTDEDLKYDSKIVFTTPFGNKFNNKDFKRPDLYSSDALLKKFQNNNVMNDFDILISFLRLFNSNDRAPVSSAMSLVGSDLNGEKLKEFMYHFEQGTASIYNKNLNNDLSM